MKQLIFFILLFTLFSCEKDDDPVTLSDKYSKQEIFNAVVGTWKFNRLAYDPEFKKIKNIEAKPCTEFDRTIFRPDSSVFNTFSEGCNNYDPDEIGSFYVKIGGHYSNAPNDTYIVVEHCGVFLYPGNSFGGILTLHSFTDSTLVFGRVRFLEDDGNDEFNLYSELKRVK